MGRITTSRCRGISARLGLGWITARLGLGWITLLTRWITTRLSWRITTWWITWLWITSLRGITLLVWRITLLVLWITRIMRGVLLIAGIRRVARLRLKSGLLRITWLRISGLWRVAGRALCRISRVTHFASKCRNIRKILETLLFKV